MSSTAKLVLQAMADRIASVTDAESDLSLSLMGAVKLGAIAEPWMGAEQACAAIELVDATPSRESDALGPVPLTQVSWTARMEARIWLPVTDTSDLEARSSAVLTMVSAVCEAVEADLSLGDLVLRVDVQPRILDGLGQAAAHGGAWVYATLDAVAIWRTRTGAM